MGMILEFDSSGPEFDYTGFNQNLELFFIENGIPEKKLFPVELIVEELVTNVFKYGGRKTPQIQIRLEVTEPFPRLLFEMKNDTEPFDPTDADEIDITLPVEKREIGGLGIFLIRKKSSDLSYRYSKPFNIITLTV